MKVKVSEASGPVLDYMVALAEGLDTWGDCCQILLVGDDEPYHPSADWSQGGPIIEREKIDTWVHARKFWAASKDKGATEFRGPTPLIASMRCYVASKLGDEVEVPDELI